MENNETEDKQFKEISQKEEILTSIDLEMDQDKPNQIKRIVFVLVNGKITWKPVMEKEEYQGGLKIIRKCKMDLENIPEKLKIFANEIKAKGKIKVNADYKIMEVMKDDELKSYKFVGSLKQFNSWILNIEV